MTEKELHKLKREDLLRLLLAQSREVIRMKTEAEERETELDSVKKTNASLKEKLTEKTAQLDKLKQWLKKKDEQKDALKQELGEKDAQVEKLRTRLDEKAEELRNAIERQPVIVSAPQPDLETERRLRSQLYEKEDEIRRLKSEHEQDISRLQKQQVAGSLEPSEPFPDLGIVIEEFQANSLEMKRKLDAKEAQLEKLNRQLEQKDTMLRDIRAELQNWRNGYKQEQKQMLSELRGNNEYLRRSLEDRDAQIKELKLKTEQKEQEIRELWARIWGSASPTVEADGINLSSNE